MRRGRRWTRKEDNVCNSPEKMIICVTVVGHQNPLNPNPERLSHTQFRAPLIKLLVIPQFRLAIACYRHRGTLNSHRLLPHFPSIVQQPLQPIFPSIVQPCRR
ncbi:hypothetical protein AAHE18_01G126900 [Arachis hypogaea]